MSDSTRNGPKARKYLVVDDHAEFRKLVRDLLHQRSLLVLECASGAEALATFETERPDCVLMDIEMDGMDGLETTRSIRSKFPDARIIILSQHDSAELREAASEAGASAYLQKDNLNDLLRVLSSHVQDPGRTLGGPE